MFFQLWHSGIHPKLPTPTTSTACHAPRVSVGLFRVENGFLVPKRSAEYFLHPLSIKCGVTGWVAPSEATGNGKNPETLQKGLSRQELTVSTLRFNSSAKNTHFFPSAFCPILVRGEGECRSDAEERLHATKQHCWTSK